MARYEQSQSHINKFPNQASRLRILRAKVCHVIPPPHDVALQGWKACKVNTAFLYANCISLQDGTITCHNKPTLNAMKYGTAILMRRIAMSCLPTPSPRPWRRNSEPFRPLGNESSDEA